MDPLEFTPWHQLAPRGITGDVKDTFSSWDKCMAKSYCKSVSPLFLLDIYIYISCTAPVLISKFLDGLPSLESSSAASSCSASSGVS